MSKQGKTYLSQLHLNLSFFFWERESQGKDKERKRLIESVRWRVRERHRHGSKQIYFPGHFLQDFFCLVSKIDIWKTSRKKTDLSDNNFEWALPKSISSFYGLYLLERCY